MNLEFICEQFLCPGNFHSLQTIGRGHINDTFLVTFSGDKGQNFFVLQHINWHVFPDPEQLMYNIVLVTQTIKTRLLSLPSANISYVPLEVIRTRNGNCWYEDENGSAWRMYNYITDGYCTDELSSPAEAFEISRMFGFFQKCMSDLDPNKLFITIPNFHNANFRYRHFQEILKQDPCQRALKAQKEIAFLQEHVSIFSRFEKELLDNTIPLRVTHNDTKVNNVLLNKKTGRGMTVLDLDTVMPGYSLYDFGDLVRSGSCRAAEDETDLDKVIIDTVLFEKLTEGYLSQARDFLTEKEITLFPLSGMYITLIMAMRFLTDYLKGDIYYKLHRPEHNLDRTRTQIALVQSLLKNEEKLNAIVEKFSKQTLL